MAQNLSNDEKQARISFLKTLQSLTTQDSSGGRTVGFGKGNPFAREYWIPATDENIVNLKSIEMFSNQTIQRADNKEHPDYGKSFCVFTAYEPDEIEKKLNELEVSAKESIENRYNISFEYGGEQSLVIEDIVENKVYNIPSALVDEEKVAPYNIMDRMNRINELEQWIGECARNGRDSDKELMKDDLEYLEQSSEEYVFENYGTNGFIAKDVEPKAFNDVCKEMIESYEEYLQNAPQKRVKR